MLKVVRIYKTSRGLFANEAAAYGAGLKKCDDPYSPEYGMREKIESVIAMYDEDTGLYFELSQLTVN